MSDEGLVALLFESEWYSATNPDVAGQDPLEHFLQIGAAAGRNPNPLFDSVWYLQRYPEVARSGLTALDDFCIHGVEQGRDPGPMFSTKWYLATYTDVAMAGVNPLAHYISCGRTELRDPSPVFDSAWYFATYPFAASPGLDARTHYMQQGAMLGCKPCPLFDPSWYMDTYPEVAARGIDPLLHYLTEGAVRGYDPGPHFSTSNYVKNHEALMTSGENPLTHYLGQNINRSRLPSSASTLVSGAAMEEVRATIRALSAMEPDLVTVPEALETLPLLQIAPTRRALAWRRLYLSIYDIPRHVLVVGSIDDVTNLGELEGDTEGLLIIETDAKVASTAEFLASQIPWRSLSEFDPDLDLDDRAEIVTALINGMQPRSVLVWGSQAGWEMLAQHGARFYRDTALFATATASPNRAAADLVRHYFRGCIHVLSAFYGPDMTELRFTARLLGLPHGDDCKLRDLRTWRDAEGFLGRVSAES